MILAIISCALALIIPASAATSGGTNTRTIKVQTQADWYHPGTESITLKQNKCKYTYQKQQTLKPWKWDTKTATKYAYYNITIKNETTGKTQTKKWQSASIKLKLDRDCRYSITVSYGSWNTFWIKASEKGHAWNSTPSWWVSATHKASAW